MALKFRKRKNRDAELERVNLLGLSPSRVAEWEVVEGRVVILRPPSVLPGVRGILDRFLNRMSAHRVRLDELGSFAWSHLDGKLTVMEVGELMRSEFGEQVEPVEERLGHMIWVLRNEGFIQYPEWDDSE